MASALGLLLLQALLAPGDLACALRHHAAPSGNAATPAGAHDMATHGAAAMHTAAMPAGHDAGVPLAAQGSEAPASSPGDHCSDPARTHCAWMSACAPVAVMDAATASVPTHRLAQLAPAPASPRLPAAVALLPEVPPPRG